MGDKKIYVVAKVFDQHELGLTPSGASLSSRRIL